MWLHVDLWMITYKTIQYKINVNKESVKTKRQQYCLLSNYHPNAYFCRYYYVKIISHNRRLTIDFPEYARVTTKQ